MSKFFGPIGYVTIVEKNPGVWEEQAIEKEYTGDILKNYQRWESTDKVNDDINISNTISIIADPFAFDNLSNIRYVKWMGAYWKVTGIEVQRPRIILSIGGVYNGKKN